MQRKRIVCVDIGSNAVKVVVGVKNGEQLEVVATASEAMQGVACGVVRDLEQCTKALKTALNTVKAKESDYLVVGMSGYYVEQIPSNQNKFVSSDGNKQIAQQDIDDLYEKAKGAFLQEELQQLDVVLKYYNVDDLQKIQNPLNMQGVKLEAFYNVFSYRKALLKNIEQCVESAGFEVGHFAFSPCHISPLLFGEEEKQSGVLVLDIGADTTRSSVFVEGALYSSFAVPFGSRSLTLDIKNSYPVSMVQAEKLKKQFSSALVELAEENTEVVFKSDNDWGGNSLLVSQLSGVVQCRLDEIFRGIRYQLRKLDLEDLIESVIVLGGGAEQKEILAYLKKCFQVPVKKASLNGDILEGVSELPANKFVNALGVLTYELNREQEIEDEEEKEGIIEKVARGWRSFFGGKPSKEDAKM